MPLLTPVVELLIKDRAAEKIAIYGERLRLKTSPLSESKDNGDLAQKFPEL